MALFPKLTAVVLTGHRISSPLFFAALVESRLLQTFDAVLEYLTRHVLAPNLDDVEIAPEPVPVPTLPWKSVTTMTLTRLETCEIIRARGVAIDAPPMLKTLVVVPAHVQWIDQHVPSQPRKYMMPPSTPGLPPKSPW
ncbi:hypothetical protein GGF32_008214 [Allomyces javanicus]|nr:hypothetical protein GGF32_008214 [Allomyces javanicus]